MCSASAARAIFEVGERSEPCKCRIRRREREKEGEGGKEGGGTSARRRRAHLLEIEGKGKDAKRRVKRRREGGKKMRAVGGARICAAAAQVAPVQQRLRRCELLYSFCLINFD